MDISNHRDVDLSVVIAAYNEGAVIENSIRRIVDELDSRDAVRWELICVNDGSRDDTGILLDSLSQSEPRLRSVHLRRNFGQGRALRAGFDLCRGGTIVTMDADLSYSPSHIYRMLDVLKEKNAEIVLASAYTRGGSVKNVPYHRRFLSQVGNYYLRNMMGSNVATVTCVVRAYMREVIDTLILTSDGMELQLEILQKAARLGYRIEEIPAHLEWSSQKTGQKTSNRTSKMRINRTIRQYFLFGLLSKPALLFIPIASYLIIHGSIMVIGLLFKLISLIRADYNSNLLIAMSAGLKGLMNEQGYSVLTASFLLIIGIQLFAFVLQLIQNQLYFDELIKIMQNLMKEDN